MKKNQLKYCQSIDPTWTVPEKLWLNKAILKKACPDLNYLGDLSLVQLYICDQVAGNGLPKQIASKDFLYALDKFLDPAKKQMFLKNIKTRFHTN